MQWALSNSNTRFDDDFHEAGLQVLLDVLFRQLQYDVPGFLAKSQVVADEYGNRIDIILEDSKNLTVLELKRKIPGFIDFEGNDEKSSKTTENIEATKKKLNTISHKDHINKGHNYQSLRDRFANFL